MHSTDAHIILAIGITNLFKSATMAQTGVFLLPELLTHALCVRSTFDHAGAVAIVLNYRRSKVGVYFYDFHSLTFQGDLEAASNE